MDVIGAVSVAIDARVPHGKRSDMGEMAQMAAAETIAAVVGAGTASLFGSSPQSVQEQFAKLGTEARFGDFTRQFFGRLTDRTLQYFLSRAYAYHTGEGERFATLAAQARFADALGLHCREAAGIVKDFGGQWFDKTRFEQDGRITREITRENARGFAHVAMQKVVAELKAGARPAAPSRLGGSGGESQAAGGTPSHA